MPKVKSHTLIARQNRNRQRFNREIKSIMKKDAESNRENAENNIYETTENIPYENKKNENFDSNLSLQESLRRWALDYNISKRAINALLKILISFGMCFLPNDSRTLLCTPRSIVMETVSNGKLWYNGIEKNLRMIFSNFNTDLNLDLCFNIDGLPLYKNSKYQFWPILASFFGKY